MFNLDLKFDIYLEGHVLYGLPKLQSLLITTHVDSPRCPNVKGWVTRLRVMVPDLWAFSHTSTSQGVSERTPGLTF